MADQTTTAITNQMRAMQCDLFELGIYNADAQNIKGEVVGAMTLRTYDADTLLSSISWLKSMNAKGNHIYIRPAGEHSLTLVDDLSSQALANMKSNGFTPALVVETSPKNYQAWLQHGEILDAKTSTACAKYCANKFDADPGAAAWRQFGRLAGFTNCKAKYRQDNGYFPFVQLKEFTGLSYTEAERTVAAAKQIVSVELAKAEERRKEFAARPPVAYDLKQMKTVDAFRQDPKYGGDNTRADLAFATYAVSKQMPLGDIESALRTRDLSGKGSDARQQDYLTRTIGKAQQNINSMGR